MMIMIIECHVVS